MDPLPTQALTTLSLESSPTHLFLQELEALSTKQAIPFPQTTQDLSGWMRFFEEFPKKDLSHESPSQNIQTLFYRILSVQEKGMYFKLEQKRHLFALQQERASFLSDAVHELCSSLPAEHATKDFYRETFSRFFHGIRPFSIYAEQFLLGDGPQELSGKIDALFQERQARFLSEMEEWKQQLARKTLELKRQFLQDVQTLGLKLPPAQPNRPLEETFSTRREIWLPILSQNHVGQLPPRYGGPERLELLTQEYKKEAAPYQEEMKNTMPGPNAIEKQTKKGLLLFLPYEDQGEAGEGSSAEVRIITLFKPVYNEATKEIGWVRKEKTLKIPKGETSTSLLMQACLLSRRIPNPKQNHIVPIHLVTWHQPYRGYRQGRAGLMDSYSGNNLSKYLSHNPALPLIIKIRFAKEIAHAIHTIHSLKVAGCDIKLQNILIEIDARGEPHAALSDFGTAGTSLPGYRNTYISYEEFKDSITTRVILAHLETDMFSFGNALLQLFYNRDILVELGLSWEQMKQEGQIVQNSQPIPSLAVIEQVNLKYAKLGSKVQECLTTMLSPELVDHITRLFSLDMKNRPTAQQMEEVLTRSIV